MLSSLNKSILLVLIVASFGALLLSGDWFMRFYWYRWHETMFRRPWQEQSASTTPNREPRKVVVPPSKGGDLSHLLGIRALQEKYEEPRPATTNYYDAWGFKNPPGVTLDECDYIVVGDSFMLQGSSMTNLFSAQLSSRLGEPVYNYAYAARGPVYALTKYFEDPRFSTNSHRTLVWGLIESDVRAKLIAGSMLWDIWLDDHPEDRYKSSTPELSYIHQIASRWSPRHLKQSLPNSSAIAQVSRKAWNVMRHVGLRRSHHEVILSANSFTPPMLFYRVNYDYLLLSDEERYMDQIVWAIGYLSNYCRERNLTLVTVLIPDKAQVYRDALPESLTREHPLPPSCLPELESRLNDKGLRVVNLLPVFRSAVEEGTLIYWRDDTHWNDKGISLAAEKVAESF